MDINELTKIINYKNKKQIINRMLFKGYFDATKDPNIKKASIAEFSNEETVKETDWIEGNNFYFKGYTNDKVKGYEEYDFVWFITNAIKDNSSLFYSESDTHNVLFDSYVFAKKKNV